VCQTILFIEKVLFPSVASLVHVLFKQVKTHGQDVGGGRNLKKSVGCIVRKLMSE
jgi:hypothetical protein